MFENIISQDAVSLLKKDLEKKCFPGAVLFCGNRGSAKLSSALEVARLLSCQRNGSWLCDCPECLLNKSKCAYFRSKRLYTRNFCCK